MQIRRYIGKFSLIRIFAKPSPSIVGTLSWLSRSRLNFQSFIWKPENIMSRTLMYQKTPAFHQATIVALMQTDIMTAHNKNLTAIEA